MYSKVLHILILAFVLVSLGAGCRSANSAQTAEQNIPRREVTDDLGRKMSVPLQVERVVSLAPSLTENVFAVGAGEKLVGVTTYCNYPAEAKQIQKIGDTLNPNLETIIALKPQLVLISTDSQIEAFFNKLEANKIPVFVTDAKSFDDVLRNLKQIGDLLGTSQNAEKLVSDLQTRRATVESKIAGAKPVRVFVQISLEPLFTVGKASFVTDLVRRAGGESVTAEVPDAYPKISKETALAALPDAIILPVDNSMGEFNTAPSDVFKDSPAVKNNRVYKINGDWLTRPSPRLIDGIETIAKSLHPEKFQ